MPLVVKINATDTGDCIIRIKCPAANQIYHNCGMLGHLAITCKNKNIINRQRLKIVRKSFM